MRSIVSPSGACGTAAAPLEPGHLFLYVKRRDYSEPLKDVKAKDKTHRGADRNVCPTLLAAKQTGVFRQPAWYSKGSPSLSGSWVVIVASTSLEQQLLGKTLAGKYRLVAVQGSGAFGTVFRAEHYFCRQLVRPVAVKVSRQSGLTEETAPYLFGDALVLAHLLASSEHEGRRHLVQIHDMGLLPDHDNRAFLVMEYVDGLPLLSHMRAAGRISVATGLRFLKQICRAMALVHGQGAVHRDLKSDNILVDRRGVVRVVDFGLAAYADRRRGFVQGAQGTFTYMAPETVHGQTTPASDVYSLGLLMYELFTGGGPHLTAPWSTDDKSDHGDDNYRIKRALRFAPPSQVQNEIRNDFRWLDGLILRCLEIDPSRRFAEAGQLLQALEACETGEDLPPLPAPPPDAEPVAPLPPPGNASGTMSEAEVEQLFREVRRLLACRKYEQVIDRLDIHRPAEWEVANPLGARTLRAMGQAYLGQGDFRAARECLEQLRTVQKEQQLLPRQDFAAALSDLFKCYRGLGLVELAQACQEEARQLL
jgi:eukaryotic-like serine/threonine-protein kinase